MKRNFFKRKGVIVTGVVLLFIISIGAGLYLGMQSENKNDSKIVMYPGHIRIIQYNISHGLNSQNKLNLSEVKNLIQQEKPDIVCFNAIDNATPQSGYINQPGKLNENLDMNFSFGKTKELADGSTGNAIFTRFPIKFAQNILFREKKNSRNAFLYVIVEYKDEELHILTTSLGKQNYKTRLRELESFIREREIEGEHIIIAGTFNANKNDREFAKLTQKYNSVFKQADDTPTHPATQPDKRKDFLLFSKNIKIMEGKVINSDSAKHISEHFPVMANIDIK